MPNADTLRPAAATLDAAPRRSPSGIARLLRVAALIGLCAALVLRANTPPSPIPASAPATEFSAERAQRHVREIAQRPHPIGSADAERVRTYLLGELKGLGITPDSQDATAVGTRYQALGHVRNIVARVPRTAPGGPAVMLMSHYDGVPAGPAASDAGSGVSVILETLRALRAGPPLTHDLIVLFTDGEEAGLLGAAAFVREHPWARDVAVTINFEARGTSGRAAMFETGPGNLDLVQLLRHAPDVSASSLTVTIYRLLPNDTDLSEVSLLDKPALNYAFIDRVDRYHTTQDDLAHQNPGSLQQEGAQALVLTRALANGTLPRPVTGDAVFSDVPLLGVIYYPESVARPLAVALVALLLIAIWQIRRRDRRWLRGVLLGVPLTAVGVVTSAGAVFGAGALVSRIHVPLGGNPSFSGVYGTAFVLLAMSTTYGCWALARRWANADGVHGGVLVLWTVLGVYLSFTQAGASFLLVWPLLASLVATVAFTSAAAREIAGWLAALVALAVMVPIIALFGPVVLGMIGTGGIATAVLVSLLAALLAPQFEVIAGERRARAASILIVPALALFAFGAVTVRSTIDHPASSLLAYAIDADSSDHDAWLVTPASVAVAGSWGAMALGADPLIGRAGDSTITGRLPLWLGSTFGAQSRLAARRVARVAAPGPTAELLSDSVRAEGRVVRLRILSPHAVLATRVQLIGARVSKAAVDGRAIDTTRFRRSQAQWNFEFNAPPDSGFVIDFTLAKGTKSMALELESMTSGLPTLADVLIPARPAGTIPVQMGDITVVRRRIAYQ